MIIIGVITLEKLPEIPGNNNTRRNGTVAYGKKSLFMSKNVVSNLAAISLQHKFKRFCLTTFGTWEVKRDSYLMGCITQSDIKRRRVDK